MEEEYGQLGPLAHPSRLPTALQVKAQRGPKHSGSSSKLHPGNVISSSISWGGKWEDGKHKDFKGAVPTTPLEGKGERRKKKKKKGEKKKREIILLSHTQYFHFITVSSQHHGNLGKILMLLLCKLGLFVLRDTSS